MENKFNKFLTLLTILLFGFGQMWADPTIPSTTLTLPATGLGSWTGVDYTNISYNDATNGYVIYSPYAIRISKSTQTWYATTGTTGSATGTWSASDIFKGNAYYSIYQAGETDASKYRMDVFKKDKTDLYHYYRVTNCTGVKLFYKSSASFSISLKVYEVTGEPGSLIATEVTAAANSAAHTKAETSTLANNSTLSTSKNYIIEVHGEEGNKANAPFYEIAFYYPAAADVTPPTLSSSTPANSATGVAVEGNIVLTFSENVTVNDASKFTLSGGAGSLTTASISVSGAAVTIPYTGLDNSTTYTLSTAAGAVKDAANNTSAALDDISFTTVAPCTKPTAPENLSVESKTHNTANLVWDGGSAGVNGYKIALTSASGTGTFDWKDEATAIYEATGLTPSTAYTFKVKYKGGAGQCDFSDEVTKNFTTDAAPTPDYLLINQSTGDVNTAHFRINKTTSTKEGGYSVAGESFTKYIQLGGAPTTPVGADDHSKIISYDAKTNSVTVEAWIYNKASSDYKFYISVLEEGSKTPTINEYTATKNTGTKKSVTFTPAKNATIYVHVGNNSNVFVCQLGIYENGTDLKKGGEIGYSVRYDSCRLVGKSTFNLTMDGIVYNNASNTVKAWTTGYPMKLKATSDYIKFILTEMAKVSIKATGTYSVTTSSTYQSESALSNNQDVVLSAGTYYICPNGSNTTFASLAFLAPPATYAVTFNMHGHGDQVPQQNILDGGKVTEPATTSISGWDFGGWYKTYVADPESYSDEWDFANDVVHAATELHAQWTEHVLSNNVALGTLTVNGEDVAIVPSQLVYTVELPFGTTAIPTVAATAADANAKACNVTQALAVDGSATIYVKAEDNTTEATYTINFSVATSKDIELVWDKTKKRCDDTTPTANVKSDDASVSAYINKITFTVGGAEGSSLNVGNGVGNMFTLTAKAGYAFKAMTFFGKIQDVTCEYSLDGGAWTELASTKTDGDKCYANIFSAAEVHEFRLRSTGTSGVWIRNMQLTIVEACTPIVVAWDEEPVEFEVGKAGYAIAATANNSGAVTYSSTDGDVIAVNGSTGALTVSALGSVTLKAATAEGDGTAYCANSGNDIEISKAVNTYYLVTFDGQNGEAANEVKYYSGDAAIALPAAPSYSGFDFQGWFDAETGGNKYLAAITPTASMTVYAQWVAQCDGATITTQPTGASYLTGRTAAALVCEATAGAGGALTYEWFTCDDEYKANPVAATATPSTAVAGTYYYFCKVTEEGCAVEAFSNVVTITVADKDAICIIKSTPTSGTEATVDGVYQGNAYFKGRAADKKLNSQYDYVGVELASGYTFLATDKVVLNQTVSVSGTDISKFYVFTEVPASGKAYATVLNASPVQGDNWFAMPTENVGQSTLYVGRVDANCNPSVGYLAVYRACAPILSKITVNSVEGTPDNTNHVTIEVPASTTQTQLEAIAYEWVSNSDAWTDAHTGVAANAWEFGVENTVTFTDKDGDQSVYTITVNKAVPSSDATLSALSASAGVLSPTFDPAVLNYTVALPYGTSNVPTLSATKNFVGAADPVIVDAATFTNRQAVSTVTVTAEDGITELTYTVTFQVERFPSIVIWDGSTMNTPATSPDATTGLAWTVAGFSVDNYSATCGSKAYTKCWKSGGAQSSSRYFQVNIPADYLAKFTIVVGTHEDGTERCAFIGTTATKTLDESSILTLYSSDRAHPVKGTSEVVLGAGTYYINPTASVDFYEVIVTLYPVDYSRTGLTVGKYGTTCLPSNVPAGAIFGAEVYKLLYWKYGTSYADCQMVEFEQVEAMNAGEPYLILPTEETFAVFYGDITVANPQMMSNGFIGTFDEIVAAPDNELVGKYGIVNNMVQKLGENCHSAPNRAYIDLSQTPSQSDYESTHPKTSTHPKRLSLGHKSPQITTELDAINVDAEGIQKVLVNGQLYIVRGGQIYTATGQLVK